MKLKIRRIYHLFVYVLAQWVVRSFFKLFFRLKIIGLENIPKKGSFLLASNHISLADPPLIGSIVRREIFFFAKEELFEIPIIGPLIKELNAFPVRRFARDIGALKMAQDVLEKGYGLTLFPEGTRSKNGELGSPKPGIGLLACVTSSPVIPIFIKNTNRLKNFKQVQIVFGVPIFPLEEEIKFKKYQEFSEKIMKSIADLKVKLYNES